MTSLQLVVAKHRPDLYQFFREQFTLEETAGEIAVILDRRREDRRRRAEARDTDVRRDERRRRAEVARHLNAVGWAFVHR